ncbi:MAG: DegT/DnrJ/EryC1/StrS family aminotransferase [Bacteroidota bacterium]
MKINVTKSYLPPKEEYIELLKKIWDTNWVTNRGPLVFDLEAKLKSYLNIKNIILTTNGTIPLQIALKILGKQGEIITTPFSYIATTSSIIWENCFPVFVDIDPEYLTIDETKIEAAVTNKTTAILATHVYGNPCNIEKIELIANKYNLKVIYDAAHAFGVKYKNQSIFNFGDVSTCSFHATKLFHTGEGGAMFCNDDELNHQLFYSHNFGHNGTLDFHGLGINGKISELQAAMGLAVLPHLEDVISERKKIVNFYKTELKNVKHLKIREGAEWNYSYFPVVFETEEDLLRAEKNLNDNDIIPRRYFYPSLNTVNYVNGNSMPISESVSKRALCLPLYVGLEMESIERIIKLIKF